MRRAGVGLVVLGVVMLGLHGMTEPSSASEGSEGSLHPCRNVPNYDATHVRANFSCAQARDVVRHYDCDPPGGACFSGGFTCHHKSEGVEGRSIRCVRERFDHRVVKWLTRGLPEPESRAALVM
jgi:hypothetical protein